MRHKISFTEMYTSLVEVYLFRVIKSFSVNDCYFVSQQSEKTFLQGVVSFVLRHFFICEKAPIV